MSMKTNTQWSFSLPQGFLAGVFHCWDFLLPFWCSYPPYRSFHQLVCNHLQMHSCELYDHSVQHQTDFTCPGFAESMAAACLHQPLHSGSFITLGTAPEQPSGKERSLGALPPSCFSPQESNTNRGRCWGWNRVGKFVLLGDWQQKNRNKPPKQAEKKPLKSATRRKRKCSKV